MIFFLIDDQRYELEGFNFVELRIACDFQIGNVIDESLFLKMTFIVGQTAQRVGKLALL